MDGHAFEATQAVDITWDKVPYAWIRMLLGVVNITESKHPTTAGHSNWVTTYATALGIAVGLSTADISALRVGTYLHDIGKIAIPERILYKPGRLTRTEYQAVQAHPVVGAAMMRPVFSDLEPRIIDVVEYHHERFDGTGYPRGLAGDMIPLWSRICALADAWDAMTHPRPYRAALSLDAAAEEMVRCRGTQFDPELVPLFLDHVVAKERQSAG